MKYEILKKEALTIAELGDLIKSVKKKDLAPVHQKVGDYSTKFSKLNKDKSAKLKREISKLDIPRLDDEHITAIVNLLPKDMNELKNGVCRFKRQP